MFDSIVTTDFLFTCCDSEDTAANTVPFDLTSKFGPIYTDMNVPTLVSLFGDNSTIDWIASEGSKIQPCHTLILSVEVKSIAEVLIQSSVPSNFK